MEHQIGTTAGGPLALSVFPALRGHPLILLSTTGSTLFASVGPVFHVLKLPKSVCRFDCNFLVETGLFDIFWWMIVFSSTKYTMKACNLFSI
jgi:hypothetical protein